jgi:murein DD-endopeptidase MepM/ murein hydrolase activator NlpD
MAPRKPWLLAICALLGVGFAGSNDPGYGTYAWPVEGPVIRSFEPPSDPFGPGHRGIDIGAPFATPLVAAQDGVVAFAGWVGGSLFISIDHDDGVRSTYSWLSAVEVDEGQTLVRGQAIGRTGQGHPDVPTPHLHFGTRIGTTYIDPMLMLERGSVVGLIHLAPMEPSPGPGLPDEWLRPPEWPTYNERSWKRLAPWPAGSWPARSSP